MKTGPRASCTLSTMLAQDWEQDWERRSCWWDLILPGELTIVTRGGCVVFSNSGRLGGMKWFRGKERGQAEGNGVGIISMHLTVKRKLFHQSANPLDKPCGPASATPYHPGLPERRTGKKHVWISLSNQTLGLTKEYLHTPHTSSQHHSTFFDCPVLYKVPHRQLCRTNGKQISKCNSAVIRRSLR